MSFSRSKSRWFYVVLVAIMLASLLAACGSTKKEEVVEDKAPPLLPRLTVQLAEDGSPTVAGIPVATLAGMFGQQVAVSPDTVQQFTSADIQNLEAVITKEGIFLFENGEPLPYLALDDESRGNLGGLVEKFGLVDATNAKRLQWAVDNIVSRLGVPVVVKFPVAAGEEEAPLREEGVLPRVHPEDAAAEAGERSMVMYADVEAASDGSLTVGGLSLKNLEDSLKTAGFAADLSGASLDPALLATLAAADVQHLQIETEPDGLYLYMDGKSLPRVAWDKLRLDNAVEMYGRLDPSSPYLPIADLMLPGVQPADIELLLLLPKLADLEEITPRSFQ
ncbi:MAG: hypothetical protein U9R25_07870 [Chloroflexota bacterium]|nr:hypothetical protein [Chloroflexota bacterium]